MQKQSTRMVAAALAATAASLWVAGAQAREPGVAPQIPPGLTIGLPIAASPPPGFYVTNRTAYYSAKLKDNGGNYQGQDVSVFSESMQFTWVPGWKLLGASYKAFVSVPFVNVHMTRTTTATGPLGSWQKGGFADPKFQPLDLSWNLGGGFFFGAAVGFYAPIGTYNKGDTINPGANFWTLEPSIGLTYLKDGWNASLHVIYDTNTENRDTKYRSGDQIFLNATVTKNIDGWNVGPVGYYMKQVTGDVNRGGLPSYGGRVFDPQELLAVGGLISRQVGPFNLTAFYTHEVYARNTLQGGKFWFNVGVKMP